MTKKQTSWSHAPGTPILTRRAALTLSAAAAASLYLPGGLMRSARAQASGGTEYGGLTPDYYISPTGSNSNNGLTPSTAWALNGLNSKGGTYAGSVVGLVDGTYNLFTIMGSPSSGGFDTNRLLVSGGSSGSPTVLVSQSPRGAIIDGARETIGTGISWENGLMGPNGSYVTFDGIHFTGANYRAITSDNGGTGGSNFTVKNCLFTDQSFITGASGANSATFYTKGFNNILISNCRFEGGSSPSDSNRHAVIQTYQSTNGLTIEYCTFIGQSSPRTGNMVHCKQGNNKNIIIRNCYFEHHAGTPFWQIQGSTSDSSATYEFYNNVLNRVTGSADPALWNEEPGWNGVVSIYNNTFWGATNGLTHLYRGGPQSVSFYNNIIGRPNSPSPYGDLDLPAIGVLGTLDSNLYDSSPTMDFHYNSGANSSSGLSARQMASGKDTQSSDVSEHLFVGSGTDAAYFRLQSGSLGKTLGAGGREVGAWGGASQVGASFGGGILLAVPMAPQITSVI
jgi:hypothetical protein